MNKLNYSIAPNEDTGGGDYPPKKRTNKSSESGIKNKGWKKWKNLQKKKKNYWNKIQIYKQFCQIKSCIQKILKKKL